MKNQKMLGIHKDNKAPESRKRQIIPPPQQTTDLSTSAEGLKVAVGLLFLIQYGICSLLSKQNNSITMTGWGRLKYPKSTSGGWWFL